MLARVISDNGYKLELVRPLREQCLVVGSLVNVEIRETSGDLQKIFDTMLDANTQDRIVQQMYEFNQDALKKSK